MFNYNYINELDELGTCIFMENEIIQEMTVKNREVLFALYEYDLSLEECAYSMIANYVGADEDKGLVWAVGLTSGIGSQKNFDSRKETNRYYNQLKKKAPSNFKLIYEGNKNVG